MNEEKEITDLQVGDEVAFYGRYNELPEIVKVEKITRKGGSIQIHLPLGYQFNKRGSYISASGYSRLYIKPVTPKLLEEIEQKKREIQHREMIYSLTAKIRSSRLESLPAVTLTRILELIDSN